MKKILRNEDEAQNREMFIQCLEAKGFDVIAVHKTAFLGLIKRYKMLIL